MNGFLIKDFVAPTICMVFIVKRCEYTERRNELLINNIATTVKTLLTIKIQKLISFTLLFTKSTNCLS